jgi:hypothetical protein
MSKETLNLEENKPEKDIKEEIDKLKKLNFDFIDELLQKLDDRIAEEPENSQYVKIKEEVLEERKLIDEIMELGKKAEVMIDPQYYTIPMGLSKRLGEQRLKAIKELFTHFVPAEKIQGHLKEIDVQREEAYISLGCEGFFHDGVAEIPNFVTFNNENPEIFYATFLHESAGHPIGEVIAGLDDKTKKALAKNHRKLRKEKAFFKGSFGHVYPETEMADFNQFIAEFTKQYCLEGDDLRAHIEDLPPEQQKAYESFYDFFREEVYQDSEFGDKDLEALNEISKQIKEKAKPKK